MPWHYTVPERAGNLADKLDRRVRRTDHGAAGPQRRFQQRHFPERAVYPVRAEEAPDEDECAHILNMWKLRAMRDLPQEPDSESGAPLDPERPHVVSRNNRPRIGRMRDTYTWQMQKLKLMGEEESPLTPAAVRVPTPRQQAPSLPLFDWEPAPVAPRSCLQQGLWTMSNSTSDSLAAGRPMIPVPRRTPTARTAGNNSHDEAIVRRTPRVVPPLRPLELRQLSLVGEDLFGEERRSPTTPGPPTHVQDSWSYDYDYDYYRRNHNTAGEYSYAGPPDAGLLQRSAATRAGRPQPMLTRRERRQGLRGEYKLADVDNYYPSYYFDDSNFEGR
jgi:hypothetical protein